MAFKSLGWKRAFLPALTAATALSAGCYPHDESITTTDLQTHKIDRSLVNRKDKHLQQMSDNAMLSDMTLWDYHFVPHTSELSGSGAERLTRMAFYLDTYGGKVRYDTLLTDQGLIKERIAHVREFLKVSGADVSRVEVEAQLPGGRMFSGEEAIKVAKKGTAKPQGGAGATTVIGPAPNP